MAHTDSPVLEQPARLLRRAVALAVLALFVALSGTSGCMVMDELDNAAAKMPDKKQTKKTGKEDPSGESLGAAGRLAAAKSALNARSQKWWQEAKTMTPGQVNEGIVQCRLPEGAKFMSRDDCIVQGGRFDG